MATFTHKGIEITLDEKRGDFSATIGGKRERAASLSAIKARIDKAKTPVFEPWDGLREGGTWDKGNAVVSVGGVCLVPVRIVGIEKTRCGMEWRSESGRVFGVHSVLRDTPEQRALWQQFQTERQFAESERDRLRQIADATKEKLDYPKIPESQ